MRTKILALVIILLAAINLQGQTVTKAFTWQGIIKDDTGSPIASQSVSLRIGIREGTATGNLAYRETHQITTSPTGHVGLEVGNGQPTIGSLAAIDWTTNNYFQEVELDVIGNGNFQSIGTSPIRPIPLAIDVLNKNETIKTVNADNYQSISLEEKDRVLVEGDISIIDTYTKLNVEKLYVYGGNFTGTTGNRELVFGNYSIIRNAHFHNVTLVGSWLNFENCHFSGDIYISYNATIIDCSFREATTSYQSSIGNLQNCDIINSTLSKVSTISNSFIYESTVEGATKIINSDISHSTIGKDYLSLFANNDVYKSKVYTHLSMTDNYFRRSKIIIPYTAYSTLIIANNFFENVYTDEKEIITIEVDESSLKLRKIVNNVFQMHTNDECAIHITGNTTTLSTLNISNNMFYEGIKAITRTSNIKTVVKDNITTQTSLGVSNNGDNLRVFDNIDF